MKTKLFYIRYLFCRVILSVLKALLFVNILRPNLISHSSLRSARTSELDMPAEHGYRRRYLNTRRTTRTNTQTHEHTNSTYYLFACLYL